MNEKGLLPLAENPVGDTSTGVHQVLTSPLYGGSTVSVAMWWQHPLTACLLMRFYEAANNQIGGQSRETHRATPRAVAS